MCLIDVLGKLLEQLVLKRLKIEIDKGEGLSENQFGFREGRSTINAVQKVIDIAEEARRGSRRTRKICAVVLLDVRNAFNSASWQGILDVLKEREVAPYVQRIIRSYLENRRIIMEAEGRVEEREVHSGVPQGSVLGPTLWNLLYDGVLRLRLPKGVNLVGFADDLALVVTARREGEVSNIGNRALRMVTRWMQQSHLSIAPEKTEAIVLTKARKLAPITFDVMGTEIEPKAAVKYLGVWLDTKLTFAEHVGRTANKAGELTAALGRLMSNVWGPRGPVNVGC